MERIQVSTWVNATLARVWECWNSPEHVMQWNFAVADWHCPGAYNKFIVGGEFHYVMASRDGSMEFDFWGTYDQIVPEQLLEITLGDGRKLTVQFAAEGTGTRVTELFQPENQNPAEMQQAGWQMILENFKKHTESLPA